MSNHELTYEYTSPVAIVRLLWSEDGRDSCLTLSFDDLRLHTKYQRCGCDEVYYNGDAGESAYDLAEDLKGEIKAYLEFRDTSSFYDQQELKSTGEFYPDDPGEDSLYSERDLFDEFSVEMLYEFIDALEDFIENRKEEVL